ncbi:MAG: hypothetical protein HXX18_07600 [Bacteroidetes bacterium]|nr:hypothetical protein [Bacteroidota bacterium]
MNTTTIASEKRSLSLTIAEFILLFLLGAMAIVLHARLRIPLRLPGRHGIEFMMLLLIGRNISKFRFASSFSSLGVASMLVIPMLGFKDPFMSVVFILPGIAIDSFYNVFPKINKNIWFLALAAGIAYALIPISRLLISLSTGFVYESLLGSFFYPLATHFVFGFIGGLGGSALVKAFNKKK